MLLYLTTMTVFAQECPEGCIDEATLPPECLPPVPACPLQAFGGTIGGANTVSWLYDDGTWSSLANGTWQAEPFNLNSPYAAGSLVSGVSVPGFQYPMIGEGTSSGAWEWSCGVNTNGDLNCFGYDTIVTNTPSGEAPYSALSSGSTGRFAVLNNQGRIRVWGNTAGGFGSPPATTGFAELGVGRDVACAVGIVNGGVTCWGTAGSAYTAIVNSPLRPTRRCPRSHRPAPPSRFRR